MIEVDCKHSIRWHFTTVFGEHDGFDGFQQGCIGKMLAEATVGHCEGCDKRYESSSTALLLSEVLTDALFVLICSGKWK